MSIAMHSADASTIHAAERAVRTDVRLVRSGPPPLTMEPWLARLRAAIPIAREGSDPEGVHQLRVSLARIDVWLSFSGPSALRRDVRRLRRRASAVRDFDVLMARKPPESVRRAVLGPRRVARRELRDALAPLRVDPLLDALAVAEPAVRRDAQRRVARLARTACERGREVQRHAHDVAALHAVRRSTRRVRIALEWLGRDAHVLAALQDALGEVGDRVASLAILDRVKRPTPAVRRHRRALRDELDEVATVARAQWRASRRVLEALT